MPTITVLGEWLVYSVTLLVITATIFISYVIFWGFVELIFKGWHSFFDDLPYMPKLSLPSRKFPIWKRYRARYWGFHYKHTIFGVTNFYEKDSTND